MALQAKVIQKIDLPTLVPPTASARDSDGNPPKRSSSRSGMPVGIFVLLAP